MKKINKAFTLVELIVVITILAILWTIAFISLQWYSRSSRDSVRLSDVSNMKTSLELFHLNAWKYPLPHDYSEVKYDTDILWYQWTFWETVISQLSRNLSEIPTDPLTEKEYIFSTANNKNEFEILTLLEWDLGMIANIQANAATIVVTPRIDWTYNWVFIETSKYIVPVPTIINAEVDWVTLILNDTNIKSQITDGWENIPNIWNVNYSTGTLIWLVLSVYTWSITNDSTEQDKIDVINLIQNAYSWSVLSSDSTYEQILLWDTDYIKLQLANWLFLWKILNISEWGNIVDDIITSENPVNILLSWLDWEEFTCDLCN